MGCSHDRRRYRGRRPATPIAATTLDDESRQAAIVEWTHRMGDELVASRLFAGLLPQMMRAGVDAGFQAAAAEAVVDALRHARLCAAVIESLGGEVHTPVLGFEDVPRHEDVGTLEALLRNVLSICCLEETAAVALLENDHRLARESTLRRVIAEILDDEIRHSRLGWRMLQSLAPRIDGPMRKRLGAYLVPAFARLFDRHLTSGEAPGAQTVSAEGPVRRGGQRGDRPAAGGVRPAGPGGRRGRPGGARPGGRHGRLGGDRLTRSDPLAPRSGGCGRRGLGRGRPAVRRPPTLRAASRLGARPAPPQFVRSGVGEAPAGGPSRGGPCSAPRLPSMIRVVTAVGSRSRFWAGLCERAAQRAGGAARLGGAPRRRAG